MASPPTSSILIPTLNSIRCDSSSESSGSSGMSPMPVTSRLRSRNSFARRQRERNDQMDSPEQQGNESPCPEDDSKQKQRGPPERHKRRIVIGHESLPPRIRSVVIRTKPVCDMYMKLRFRYKLFVAMILFFVYLNCKYSLRRTRIYYFGLHNIHGGTLGEKLDRRNLELVIAETHKRRAKELAKLGVTVPERVTSADVLSIDTSAALRENLIRREARSKYLSQLEEASESYQRGALDTNNGGLHMFQFNPPDLVSERCIPRHIFVPDVAGLLRPRPAKPASFTHLTFDESEMRLMITDNYVSLLHTFNSLTRLKDRVSLWAICALYLYGGVYLGQSAVTHTGMVLDVMTSAHGLFEGYHTHSSSPTGLAVFNKAEPTDADENSTVELFMMASSPRHPHLRCVLNQLENSMSQLDASQILSAFFLDESWESSHTFHHLSKTRHDAPWEMLTTQCGYGHAHTHACCRGMIFHEVQELPLDGGAPTVIETQGTLYVQLLELDRPKSKKGDESLQTTVEVIEKEDVEAPVKTSKMFLEDVLTAKNIAPGWLCTRCLKTALYGTLEKCASVCNSGYADFMCEVPDKPEKAEVVFEVIVNTPADEAQRIPRIIHQTWFEELSSDRYPELVRLQNSWKHSGWEYRFYTDESARRYIQETFPSRFVDAFDALIPGAYKADLFRYLVLMKEGGIYADVDILLDASLDEFVTPSLSFFAPRDLVCEYADESFCLWNGMIGSAPGHPFMIRAAERVVNMILDRADVYDMERDICRREGRTMENWKVRAEPLLLASGPCALGVAVNDVLGRNSLSRFDIGWIPSDAINYGEGDAADHGDALILVGDKFDLGSFRISDAERSFILASTDLPGISKEARELSNPTRAESRRRNEHQKPRPHYSEAARGEFVWGMHNVYHDDLVNNEVVKLDVIYK